jgi:hypothetical protein
MNKFKEQEKSVSPEAEPVAPPAPKKQNKLVRSFVSIFSGSFLSEDATVKQLPFIFFLTAIALCYVANGYYVEHKVRNISKVTNELKELKSEYIITKSDLMFLSKQSEVAKATATMGIKESVIPPQKIIDTLTVLENNSGR